MVVGCSESRQDFRCPHVAESLDDFRCSNVIDFRSEMRSVNANTYRSPLVDGWCPGHMPVPGQSGANDFPCAPQGACSNSTSGNTGSNPNTGGSNSGSNANRNCFEHETPIAYLEGMIANQRLSGAGLGC